MFVCMSRTNGNEVMDLGMILNKWTKYFFMVKAAIRYANSKHICTNIERCKFQNLAIFHPEIALNTPELPNP